MTPEDKALLNSVVSSVADQFPVVPCHSLNLVPQAPDGTTLPANVTNQHFSFPRNLVMKPGESTVADNGMLLHSCYGGQCTGKVYLGLTPKDIIHQDFDPFEKIYFYTAEIAQSPDDLDSAPPPDRGTHLGFGKFSVYKQHQNYIDMNLMMSLWGHVTNSDFLDHLNSRQMRNVYFGSPTESHERPLGERHLPYVIPEFFPEYTAEGQAGTKPTWLQRQHFDSFLSSIWNPLNQEGRKNYCQNLEQLRITGQLPTNLAPLRCSYVQELCVSNSLSGFSRVVRPPDDDEHGRMNPFDAPVIDYSPYREPPTYWGYHLTKNYDLNNSIESFNKIEKALMVLNIVPQMTPGVGPVVEAWECRNVRTFTCFMAAGGSLIADVAMLIPGAASGAWGNRLKKITKLASTLSQAEIDKLQKWAFRINLGKDLTMATIHGNRGEYLDSFGYALGPAVDFAVLIHTKGVFRKTIWNRFRTTGSICNLSNPANRVASLSSAATDAAPRTCHIGPLNYPELAAPIHFPRDPSALPTEIPQSPTVTQAMDFHTNIFDEFPLAGLPIAVSRDDGHVAWTMSYPHDNKDELWTAAVNPDLSTREYFAPRKSGHRVPSVAVGAPATPNIAFSETEIEDFISSFGRGPDYTLFAEGKVDDEFFNAMMNFYSGDFRGINKYTGGTILMSTPDKMYFSPIAGQINRVKITRNAGFPDAKEVELRGGKLDYAAYEATYNQIKSNSEFLNLQKIPEDRFDDWKGYMREVFHEEIECKGFDPFGLPDVEIR